MRQRATNRRALRILPLVIVGSILMPVTGRAEGDWRRGKREFLRCATCHAAESAEHRNGPSLATVYGRTAGTVEGFGRYSDALKRAGVVWTEEALDAWLRNPKAVVPGNSMVMPGIAAVQVRLDLIAYLRELAARNRTTEGPTR